MQEIDETPLAKENVPQENEGVIDKPIEEERSGADEPFSPKSSPKKTHYAKALSWVQFAVAVLLFLCFIAAMILGVCLPAVKGASFLHGMVSSKADAGLKQYGLWVCSTAFASAFIALVALILLPFKKTKAASLYAFSFDLVGSVFAILLSAAFAGQANKPTQWPLAMFGTAAALALLNIIWLACFFEKPAPMGEEGNGESKIFRGAEIALSLVAYGALIATLFLPFYYLKDSSASTDSYIGYKMADALQNQCDLTIILITFSAFFAVLLVIGLMMVVNLKNLLAAPARFTRRNRAAIYACLAATATFAVMTFVFCKLIYPAESQGRAVLINAIPFLVVGATLVVEAAISARFEKAAPEKKKKPFSYSARVGALLSLVAMCVVTCLALLGRIITIKGTYNGAQFYPEDGGDGVVTGIDLLQQYVIPSTKGSASPDSILSGKGFSLLALLVFVFLVSDALFLLFGLVSFFRKSKSFYRISLIGCVALYIEVLVIWVFGLDYSIAAETNKEAITTYLLSRDYDNLEALGYTKEKLVSDLTSYTLTTTTGTMIYFLVSSAAMLLIVVFRPFTRHAVEEEVRVNISSADVREGGKPLEASGSKSKAGEEEGETAWACPKCGVLNHGKFCENCGAPGPFAPVAEEENGPVSFDPCPAFTLIDEAKPEREAKLKERSDNAFANPTLPAVAHFVVDYARDSRLHLSYSQETIATFLAGLGATKLTILQGMSGTGKTSLPKIFAEALGCDCRLIEVESSWKDKNELIGYYNEFTKLFTPRKFTSALYEATLEKETLNFIVLDEMNLSRIEYYFSDFLSLMEAEPDKRVFSLSSTPLRKIVGGEREDYLGLEKGTTIRVTPNIWFIGTANRDESTFEISDKVYDRSNVINLNHRAPKAIPQGEPRSPRYLSYDALQGLFDSALSSFPFDLDSIPFLPKMEEILAPYNISFGNRIARQIEVYVKIYCSCFEDPQAHLSEALESILLDKVVHKLEYKAVEDKESLAESFEAIGLKRCAAFVRSLSEDL